MEKIGVVIAPVKLHDLYIHNDWLAFRNMGNNYDKFRIPKWFIQVLSI